MRRQLISGPGIVEWALPVADIGILWTTVQLGDDDLDPDTARRTWCPVCATATTMRAAVTDDERRFDLCDGCGLLWHVERTLGRAIAHRVAVRTAPADPRPGTRTAAPWTGPWIPGSDRAHTVDSP